MRAALDFAQRYTAQGDFSSIPRASAILERTHVFMDSTEAQGRGIRRTLPAAAV